VRFIVKEVQRLTHARKTGALEPRILQVHESTLPELSEKRAKNEVAVIQVLQHMHHRDGIEEVIGNRIE
jgi:hypothetical protein